jgi:hypothetical protein
MLSEGLGRGYVTTWGCRQLEDPSRKPVSANGKLPSIESSTWDQIPGFREDHRQHGNYTVHREMAKVPYWRQHNLNSEKPIRDSLR